MKDTFCILMSFDVFAMFGLENGSHQNKKWKRAFSSVASK